MIDSTIRIMRRRIILDDDVIDIRPLQKTDPLSEITGLLHKAYKVLADRGMRYVASHQTDEITKQRAAMGACYVAECRGQLIATVTLCPPYDSRNEWYRRPGCVHFQQFAVAPELQGRGLGSAMMDLVEELAGRWGAEEIALDTSEHADNLIDYYQSRGYSIVARQDWEETNYVSVVLSKKLAD